MKKKKEILLDQVDELSKIKLPPSWSVSKLEVSFKRHGVLEEYGEVVYDCRNNVFYVKTNKSICYPEEVKTLLEGMKIMKKANKIISSPRYCKIDEPR